MAKQCVGQLTILIFWLLTNNACFAQAVRQFSYAGPQQYTVGDNIQPLSPTFSGTGTVPSLLDTEVRLYGFKQNSIVDGPKNTAAFRNPQFVCNDGTDVYITDGSATMVRKIDAAGTVKTIAGSTLDGYVDAKGTAARFTKINSMVARNGYVYVVEPNLHVIRMISPTGEVTTFAGSGKAGATNGQGKAASFNIPTDITMDGAGNLYVGDNGNSLIRKITPEGVVTTFANIEVTDLVADPAGNVYAISTHYDTYKITPQGTQSLLVKGSPYAQVDGKTAEALLKFPSQICIDLKGNLYISGLNTIRKISPDGMVTALAGTGMFHQIYGPGNVAGFIEIRDIALDGRGNLIGTDRGTVFLVSLVGWSVYPEFPLGLSIDQNGVIRGRPERASPLTTYTITGSTPEGLQTATFNLSAILKPGIPLLTYPSEAVLTVNQVMDPIVPIKNGGTVSPLLYRTATDYVGNGFQGVVTGQGRSASLSEPSSLFFDGQNIFVIDKGGVVLKVAKHKTTYDIAGGAESFIMHNGRGTEASFNQPTGITMNAARDLFVADRLNHVIRKVDSTALVTTYAGTGRMGMNNGAAKQATFRLPSAVVCDAAGNLFVADEGNHVIRMITPAGVVSTFAGSTKGYTDGGSSGARFDTPTGLIFDHQGNLIVVDKGNYRIRKISTTGIVTTLAGSGVEGVADGVGILASFVSPTNVIVDQQGNLFVTDRNQVRKITPGGEVSTFAEVFPFEKPLYGPPKTSVYLHGITYDPAGVLYVSDIRSGTIRSIGMQGYSIFPRLPEGLSMDDTGKIYGRPVAVSPATVYTVTAINDAGTSSSKIRIEVNTEPPAPIPVSNFRVSVTSLSCRGKKDGSIHIAAGLHLPYTAALSGNGVNKVNSFSNNYTQTGLPAGSYNLCITVASMPGFKQCYTLEVTEPDDLLVETSVKEDDKQLDLKLSGADQYTIQLNGKQYLTGSGLLSLPLVSGSNTLTVHTDKFCQGSFEKIIKLAEPIAVYPNPFDSWLYVELGGLEPVDVQIKIYDTGTGRLVKTERQSNLRGRLDLNVAELSAGLYTIVIKKGDTETAYKIIKR